MPAAGVSWLAYVRRASRQGFATEWLKRGWSTELIRTGFLGGSASIKPSVNQFDLGRGLREISGFDLIDTGRRNPRRTATLRLGGCVEGAVWGRGFMREAAR